ncbi:sensor histidine kinase [Qipengyuania nanhaisediminis]|uniref:sensor histidine kinase n=1 Tax=Qipengyuania nanhaisediminis TaxID=604088 RepID=UPI0038B40437
MATGPTFPVSGFALAAVTLVAMLVLGIDPFVAIAVAVLWGGSLLLATGRPPEQRMAAAKQPIARDSMRDLVENASTPLFVTERNTIAIANRAARDLLGRHIVGQDVRVAFRQPGAISLLSGNRNGHAIVRGLVRRRDIWQINRQALDEELAVIELINQTAEADIARAHTDFVANASHELRTPLAAILGYVETLNEADGNIDTPTARKFLDTIEREARRLQALIGDLMSLSRVEAEKHELPEDLVDLKPLVERAARDAAGTDRVERLSFDLADRLNVRGDRQQLEQVVRNLVDNALKYGARDGMVEVTLDTGRESMARLSVRDNGEGISPEQLPHLTRRFYRTDPGRSRASGGTGLGLAIVKHIVQRHRGRLDIESELGRGTCVVVRLPIAETEEAAPHDDRGERQSAPDETPTLS